MAEQLAEAMSPAMDPGILDHEAARFADPEHVAVGHGRTAMQAVLDGANSLAATERAVLLAGPGAGDQRARLRELAAKTETANVKAVTAALDTIQALRVREQEAIDSALGLKVARETTNGNARASEARAVARAAGKGAFDVVLSAIAGGDVEFVAGVLTGSPTVSGLKPDEMAMLRERAEEKFAPDAFRNRHGIDRIAQRLAGASASWRSRFGLLISEDTPATRSEQRLRELETAIAAAKGGAA